MCKNVQKWPTVYKNNSKYRTNPTLKQKYQHWPEFTKTHHNQKYCSKICSEKTKKEAENFVQACMYPPRGYRSYGPIRGLVYGGPDYADEANNEILKFAMIETKESLDNLDEIMQTPGLDGIYIGPADLSLALGEKPSFDKPEGDPVYEVIMKILEHAKKNKIIAGIQNAQPEYADKMIKKGFQLVTIGTDQRFMTAAAKAALSIIRKDQKKDTGKGY